MLAAGAVVGLAIAVFTLLLSRRMRLAAGWWTELAGARTESDLAGLFVFIPAARLQRVTALLAASIVAAAWLAGLPIVVTVVLGVLFMALPRIGLVWLRQKWRRDLARQMPNALSLWAGLLRAGQGSAQALSQVAQRQTGPVGSELRLIQSQLRMGVAIDQAFDALCERSSLADLRLLSTLLATQRELGGNLAESLQRMADLLRGRLLMEARIGSLTAQGKLQGVVVGLLPLLLLCALYVMERDAMQVLHTTWQGWAALAAMLVLELLGFLMIRRIVRIEV